ncbi:MULTISPECIES: FAD-dependent oxidoreductase [unclassified Pedobacter]|uniref:FAD-binding oxidoreductase n=1 Tax=unclassified Pedobacter TaxID=2628915 RepID=UPI001D9DEDF3|nr:MULTISPECIES: FAD-binding protein [unclassified Pedobacter]CAH0243533.1 putative oxidoreductase ORF5 in fasciation locus [Pedobacter sp. Bi36]CAH0269246.1 putative oxidoreductase ORF5 in fasciation locus [Pedobacter sp. Bi126]
MKRFPLRIFLVLTTLLFACQHDKPIIQKNVVNDVTQLNPIKVAKIITPQTSAEITKAVKTHNGPISIGGARFSQGGQTATENAFQIDMRKFNRILSFSKERKEVTVQAGIRWCELIQFIDRYDLSVKIMQTYANFTVGGSLSVNVHGRYVGQGPIILSVKSFKIVLADGSFITASPTVNSEVFYTAIGGYGGIGVITEVTLSLTDNYKIARKDTLMDIAAYKKFFFSNVRNKPQFVFHNADIYPNRYKKVRAVTYARTENKLTITERLKPNDVNYGLKKFAMKVVAGSDFGKWLRQHIVDPIHYTGKVVEWRNYEATYDVQELEPNSRKKATYVLQEYFIPVDHFDSFYPKMIKVLKNNDVNVINISIRHANKDAGSYLAWAKEEVFAFVIYYKQEVSDVEKAKVTQWTRALIDASLSEKGAYYLPYQIQATQSQFSKAYPNAETFFKLKRKYDPNCKFRNKLFDAYYNPKN